MRIASYYKVPIAHLGAMGESSCSKVRSTMSTSPLILSMIRLSCSENSSDLSNALFRICSACRNWLQNHLMSFDTLFIFLFVWFDGAKV